MPTEPERSQEQNKSNQPKTGGLETYNTIAEIVGGIPSLRLKDNIIQAIGIAVVTCLSVIFGAALGGIAGAIVAAILGLIASTLISGFVLMIVGLIRAAKKPNR
jgi:VIT1/CCC1 family predicted Fe2+/Mn2+ transporter